MRKSKLWPLAVIGLVIATGYSLPVNAAPVEIEMLNKNAGETFVYSSDLLRLSVGDSVTFVPTTKGHNAQSIPGMLPDGATEVKLGFNQQGTVTFTEPGVYGIRCTPHAGAGMVTAIVVGEPVNLAAAKDAAGKLPPKARQRLLAALKSLD
ncbi:pseudoazurin [Thalassobaculum sp.]|uniref:pseudoazurin n=1 Tax=Thalassobaculum sp. TaxID=2022740 RepID=UPI0032EF327C